MCPNSKKTDSDARSEASHLASLNEPICTSTSPSFFFSKAPKMSPIYTDNNKIGCIPLLKLLHSKPLVGLFVVNPRPLYKNIEHDHFKQLSSFVFLDRHCYGPTQSESSDFRPQCFVSVIALCKLNICPMGFLFPFLFGQLAPPHLALECQSCPKSGIFYWHLSPPLTQNFGNLDTPRVEVDGLYEKNKIYGIFFKLLSLLRSALASGYVV